MTRNQQREVVKFAPNVPVEVALKFALPGKIISTQSGERMMYTLADNRVMFLDLGVAKKVEDLGVNVRENFFLCRPEAGKKDAEWNVWRAPEAQNVQVKVAPQPEAPPEETPLEQKLRESIELAKQGKLGELGNGMFAVQAGASASTPAPVVADAQNGHQSSHNGNGSTNGKNGNGNGNGNGSPHLETSPRPACVGAISPWRNQRPGRCLRRCPEHCQHETRQPGEARGCTDFAGDCVYPALERGDLWSLTQGRWCGWFWEGIQRGSRGARSVAAHPATRVTGRGFKRCHALLVGRVGRSKRLIPARKEGCRKKLPTIPACRFAEVAIPRGGSPTIELGGWSLRRGMVLTLWIW
jgi:hypothetical protein